MQRALLFLLSALSLVFASAQADVKDQVTSALGSGNVNALADKLVPSVDLTVLSSSDYYSKAQASAILKKFFDEHEPRGMRVEHEGASKLGDTYYIGPLTTANGTFRVTFLLKRTGDQFLVRQLRIEPFNK